MPRTTRYPTGLRMGVQGRIAELPELCFLARHGELGNPHVIVKSIIANPVHGFHNGSEFEEPVVLHDASTIAYHCFRMCPHACRESESNPLFHFPVSDFVNQSSGKGKLGLCLGEVAKKRKETQGIQGKKRREKGGSEEHGRTRREVEKKNER